MKLLLVNGLHHLDIKGGKARRIGDIGVLPQLIELHMPCGVAAPAQLLADFPRLDMAARQKHIENTGLAHAGVAGKGTDLTAKDIQQSAYALACGGAGADDGKTGLCKGIIQPVSAVDIHLIDADHELTAGLRRDDGDPVDQEWVCHRVGIGGNKYQRVNIGHRRADKPVFSLFHLVDAAFAVGVQAALYPVSHQRRGAVQAEAAPGLAFQYAVFGFHIVKAAERFNDYP